MKAKLLLLEIPVLAHFDPSLPLCLVGDASMYGIGVATSHIYPNDKRPTVYALCTLGNREKNYAQLE